MFLLGIIIFIIICVISDANTSYQANHYDWDKLDRNKMLTDAAFGADESQIRKNLVNGKYDKR